MSVLGVRPPNPLNVGSEHLAEEFRDFRQSWDIFVLAAEIENKPDIVKVALFEKLFGVRRGESAQYIAARSTTSNVGGDPYCA